MKSLTIRSLAAALALGLLVGGCAQKIGDIDRTQALRIPKTQFAGVWYYLQTVVDVPYNTNWTFQGEATFGGGSKIVFDIQEDLLIAYPVAETAQDVEAKYRKVAIRKYWDPAHRDEFVEMYVGHPVAAWPITKHFDIIRDYNAATGEQSNVLVENDTDRPWWMRDYIRVDWNDEQIHQLGFITGTADATSLHYVQEKDEDPLNPSAPEYEDGYISIVNSYFTTPSQSGCQLYVLGSQDCTGAVVTVRHAFKRADPASDYLIRYYPNRVNMEKFGFFLADRYAYDDYYGFTEAERDYKAQIWNIWDKPQDFVPARLAANGEAEPCPQDANADGAASGCETIPCNTNVDCPTGSRCIADEWFNGGICMVGTPRPYRERGLKPVVYHLSAGHPGISPPVPLFDEQGELVGYDGGHVVVNQATGQPHPFVLSAYDTADQWSKALKETVAWLYYYEDLGVVRPQDKREDAVACETDADCLKENQHVLFQAFIDTSKSQPASCASDAECTAAGGGKCLTLAGAPASNGCPDAVCACGNVIACAAGKPCPVGATCTSDGKCVDESGAPLFDPVATKGKPADTFVVFNDGDQARVVHLWDRILPADISTSQADNNAIVRFVNARPGSTLSLRLVTADPNDNPADANVQAQALFQNVGVVSDDPDSLAARVGYRPAVYSDDRFPMRLVAPGKARRLEVVDAGGTVVATLPNPTFAPKKEYLVVYTGDGKLVMADAPRNATGVRVVVATDGQGKFDAIDVGLGRFVLGRKLTPGTVVDHQDPAFPGPQRFVVLEGGAPGNIACFHENGFGKCVGWGPIVDDNEKAKVQAIYDELPEMFILCEPIARDPSMCADDEIGNMNVRNDCRYMWKDDQGQVHSPCIEQVRKRGGHPFMLKKIGDSRYNLFFWVNKPQQAGPLGYGPSFSDPETGEIFSAAANIYGAAMLTYGEYAKDLIDLMTGNLDVGDLITGQYIREAIQEKQKNGTEPTPQAIETRSLPLQLGNAPVDATSLDATFPLPAIHPVELPAALQRAVDTLPDASQVRSYADFVEKIALRPNFTVRLLPPNHPAYASARASRLRKLAGSWVEDFLLDDEVKTALSGGKIKPGEPIPPSERDKFSLAAFAGEDMLTQIAARNDLLARKTVFMSDFFDEALVGLAKELGCTPDKLQQGVNPVEDYLEAWQILSQQREATGSEELPADYCLRGEALKTVVTERIYGGVLEHEVGHTVGLRHNFSASADVFNYFDQWYDVRSRDRVTCFDDQSCDFVRGEVCVQSCASDSDCPPEAACQDGTCVDLRDKRLDPIGYCMAPAQRAVDQAHCQGTQATDNGTMALQWVGGACVAAPACQANADCAQGQLCQGGACVDAATNEPAGTPAYADTCTADADCGGSNRCVEGTCMRFALHIAPRAMLTKDEMEAKRTEYQYASIMDYGQKINSDIHGIGKYDYAAIRFGYGDLVDVFEDISSVEEYIRQRQAITGEGDNNIDFYRDSSFWGGSLIHPFFFLSDVIGPDNVKSTNRVPVPWQQVKLERKMVSDFYHGSIHTQYLEVPYNFCGDEYRGSLNCYTWDLGADPIEIVEHMKEMLHDYYLFDAFKRERFSFKSSNAAYYYYSRVLSRYMMPMRNAGLYYALYTQFFSNFPDFWIPFSKDPMGGAHWGISSRNAFQYLAETLSSPKPGTYVLNPDTGVFEHTSYHIEDGQDGQTVLHVPLGIGKFPYTTYDPKYGYYAYEHPLFVGSFWDKLGAFFALTASDVGFLVEYVGQQFDIGISSSIGFSLIYPDELTNLLGGIVAGDYRYWAGTADMKPGGVASFHTRNAFAAQLSNNAYIVPPSIDNLNFRVWASVYAMTMAPSAFEPSYFDGFGVFFKGHESDHVLTQGMAWKEFTDPFSGKTYLAVDPRYSDHRMAPAAELIDRANELRDAWLNAQSPDEAAQAQAQLKEVVTALDVLRELTTVFKVVDFGAKGVVTN